MSSIKHQLIPIPISSHAPKSLLPLHPSIDKQEDDDEEIATMQYFAFIQSHHQPSPNLRQFWTTSHAMSCLYHTSLHSSPNQTLQDFRTSTGCTALCVAQVLLHPSICWHWHYQSAASQSPGSNFQVLAISNETLKQFNPPPVEWQHVVKFLAELFTTSSYKQKPSVAHASPATPSNTAHAQAYSASKRIVSGLGWGVIKILAWADLTDDPDEARDLELERHMNQLTIRHEDDEAEPDHSLPTSLKNSLDLQLYNISLVLQTLELLVSTFEKWSQLSIKTDDGYQDVSEYTDPQIFIHRNFDHDNDANSQVNFHRLCHAIGQYYTKQSPCSQVQLLIKQHIPHLLQSIDELDAHLLFDILCAMGRIRTSLDHPQLCSILVDSGTTTNAQPLSSVDVALWELTLAHRTLEKRLERLHAQFENLTLEATVCKTQDQTSRAMNLLKRRKFISQQIDQCSSTLLNVEQMKLSLVSSMSDQTTLQTLAKSRNALHDFFKNDEATLEAVEELMLDFGQEFHTAKKRGAALDHSSSDDIAQDKVVDGSQELDTFFEKTSARKKLDEISEQELDQELLELMENSDDENVVLSMPASSKAERSPVKTKESSVSIKKSTLDVSASKKSPNRKPHRQAVLF